MTFLDSTRKIPREDLAAGAGLLLVAVGIFWIYKPAALVLLGVSLLVYAFAHVARKSQTTPAKSQEEVSK